MTGDDRELGQEVRPDGRSSSSVDPAKLRRLMAATNLDSVPKLALASGVSKKTLNRALGGERIRLSSIRKIAGAFEEHQLNPVAEELLGQAG